MTRNKLFAANWKMYKTPPQATEFVAAFLPMVADVTADDIALCAPAVCISAVAGAVKGSRIGVGAQNMHWEKEGAFTGEISAEMIAASGCQYVILGHSERRQYFGETDATVNRKLEVALEAGLTPIVCVGEVIEEREAGLTDDVLRRQCTSAFRGISAAKAAKLAIAYEPVWAIGTGKTATPQLAAQAHETIRHEASKAFGKGFAEKLRILYGGSVKPENAKALMSEAELDGALVGGASLDPKSFAAIVHYQA
ncbi:MAG: triose-phosphate isomerase [Acidobacteriales bacterium]|nr:triose-phosphate isomerase [Terriglobales bacterium]